MTCPRSTGLMCRARRVRSSAGMLPNHLPAPETAESPVFPPVIPTPFALSSCYNYAELAVLRHAASVEVGSLSFATPVNQMRKKENELDRELSSRGQAVPLFDQHGGSHAERNAPKLACEMNDHMTRCGARAADCTKVQLVSSSAR